MALLHILTVVLGSLPCLVLQVLTYSLKVVRLLISKGHFSVNERAEPVGVTPLLCAALCHSGYLLVSKYSCLMHARKPAVAGQSIGLPPGAVPARRQLAIASASELGSLRIRMPLRLRLRPTG